MNATERAKAEALREHLPNLPDVAYGAILIKNLGWRLDNEPHAPLSRREKYLLDLCVFHYRKKLGGLVEFEIPTERPEAEDYIPATRKEKPEQQSLI